MISSLWSLNVVTSKEWEGMSTYTMWLVLSAVSSDCNIDGLFCQATVLLQLAVAGRLGRNRKAA